MAKNELVFGDATLSSWLGMNLERGVIAPMGHDTVETLIAQGRLPEIVSVAPFVEYDSYALYTEPCESAHTHPAAAEPLRPDGFPDYNYECFLPVYSAMFDAALDAVRERPITYLVLRGDALKFSADHVEEAGYGKRVLQFIRPLYRIAFIDVRSDVDMSGWYHPLFGPGTVIVYPSGVVVIAFLICCGVVVRSLVRIRRRRASPETLLNAVAAFTVVWVVLTGALLEMGENARFRVMIHPVMILVALAATSAAWRNARNARSGQQLRLADEPTSDELG